MIIGLTGSFGTGKTLVANIFRRFGACVLDADRLAHEALRKGTAVYRKTVHRFGGAVLNSKKEIDRRALARAVFNDKRSLDDLCEIIHPAVVKNIKGEIARRANEAKVIVIDAPLLIEANLTDMVDSLVVVKASLQNQVKRCRARFGLNRLEIMKRIRSQLPLKKKVEMADFIIDNNGTKEDTEKQAREIWKRLLKEERGGRYGDN